MYWLFLALASLFACSWAVDPCDGAPTSSLAVSSVGGWIPEIGDNLFVLDIALGMGGNSIILALNPEITNQNEIMAGSSYCVPYINPVTSASWSTSDNFPWLKLEHVINPTSSAALFPPYQNSSSSYTSFISPLSGVATPSFSSALPQRTYTATPPYSDRTSNATASPPTLLATSTPATTIAPSTLLCGDHPNSTLGTPYTVAYADIAQCDNDCNNDNHCEAFASWQDSNLCFLYNSTILGFFDQSLEMGNITYWNKDCLTKTSIWWSYKSGADYIFTTSITTITSTI